MSEPAPLMWKWLVLRQDGGVCQMAGSSRHDCADPLEAHHVITQQQLRKARLAHLNWDADNGLTLCGRHHRRHHRALERVPYHCLRAHNIAFAERVGLSWLFDRYYPKTREAA